MRLGFSWASSSSARLRSRAPSPPRSSRSPIAHPRRARRFSALIEKRADGFGGRLSVGAGLRDLASPRCEDLFDAFVLFVAIAIDPEGPTTAPTPPPVVPDADRAPSATAAKARSAVSAPRAAAASRMALVAGVGDAFVVRTQDSDHPIYLAALMSDGGAPVEPDILGPEDKGGSVIRSS